MNPTLIIHNAKIYTVDSAQSQAEAVACLDGNIVAVGANDDILPLAGPRTQTINAQGRLVLPGLTDAHVHFLQYAIRAKQVSLFGIIDFAEAQQLISQAVAQAEPGQWIQGWGYDEHRWDVSPTVDMLDELAPHNPMAMARVDMHTWWVNSAALQQANISADTPSPAEGRIEHHSDGSPNGILREWSAIRLVQQHIPQPDSDTLYNWLTEAMTKAHQLGLTGIHDQRVEKEGKRSFRLWQALRRNNALKLRVHMNIASDFLPQAETLGLQPGFGDDYLWLGHVKAFADGTLGSQTAMMLEPFEGSADNRGMVVTSADEIWELGVAADKAGYSLSIHAIGDQAVRENINIMSELKPDTATGQLPHRIEHVQVIHPLDMSRLAEYGIVASVQPIHVALDWRTADNFWGERAKYTYAFRSLLDHGTTLAFGSDAPVAPISPIAGIHTAVNRQGDDGLPVGGWHPQEKITVTEAVQAYTLGPAQLAGKAQCQGSITPGKFADMIMLSADIFEIDATAIEQTKVEMTVFDGQVVFERQGGISN